MTEVLVDLLVLMYIISKSCEKVFLVMHLLVCPQDGTLIG
jgi:hypothetical protein